MMSVMPLTLLSWYAAGGCKNAGKSAHREYASLKSM